MNNKEISCPICNKPNNSCGNLNYLVIDHPEELNIKYYICNCGVLYYRHSYIEDIYKLNNKYIHSNSGSGAE
jgi:hypothetical protein